MPNRSDGRLVTAAAAFLTVAVSLAVAQTRITPPKNKYTPAQDVKLGRRRRKRSSSSFRCSEMTGSSPSWIESAGA
jgi:hypothetical protein